MNDRTSAFFVATAAAAMLAFAASATSQIKVEIDKEVKVKQWGYVIRPLKGWNAMPADQEDRYTVGRWKLALDEFEKRGNYEMLRSGGLCELKIVRIQSKIETPSAKEGDKKDSKPLPASLLGKSIPKTMDEWIENTWDGASKRWLRVPLKGGKMPGDLLEFGSGASHVTIGVFRHLGVEWAVVYTSFEENYQKTWKEGYLKSMQTFEVVENVDPDVAAAANKDPSQLKGEEKRAALVASIAGKPGWFAVNTKYYVFLSNADKQFVTQLSKDLELVREKVYVPNFKPRNQDIPLNPVRVFATASEYYQFGGREGTAGYFSSAKGELVLFQKFEEQSATKSEKDCRSVMFHEGFHQYVHFAIGDVSPHSWFNEGHGDYFAGLSVNGNQLGDTKVFEWRVKYLKDYMRGDHDLIPLRSLLRYPQNEYYANPGLKYSQGWALIYYVRNVSKNKAYKQAFETYFNYLADNVTAFRAKKKKDGDDDDKPRGEPVPGIPGVRFIDFEDSKKVEEILSQAIDKAFAAIDLEALDKELRAWVEKL